MKKFRWAALCARWLAGLAGCAAAGEAMPVIELSAGMHRIEAEVAAEDRHRQTGLMLREAMPHVSVEP